MKCLTGGREMIDHISIKNFAIIENTDVDFEEGLNIITGETGSGKSIAVEAISLALGSRADTSAIRTGADKAVVQLLGTLDGEEVVITREVSSSGKNLCKLNGEIVTLAQLNAVSRRLADIHGQYDNQSLLNPEYHITLLDMYRNDASAAKKAEVSVFFHKYHEIRQQLSSLLSQEKENARKQDFYRFEAAEIKKAALKPGEDAELEKRIFLLQNSEKIFENIEKTYAILFEESPSATDELGMCLRSLEEISSCSDELSSISEEFSDIYYRLQDLSGELRNIRESLNFSPEEMDLAISRLNTIEGLKKKYGSSIEDVLEYEQKILKELEIIENFDDEKTRLEAELSEAKKDLLAACSKLTEIRTETAAELEQRITAELADLNFKDAKLSISITPLSAPAENGMDHVEILIAANRGEPLKPLAKIASGGEMSRIMLAFKNVISSCDNIPTLIFDEIDAGISGITASIVGRKLKEIASHHQIICITHLPQIAACGVSNYRIYKETDDEKTYTNIQKLSEEGRIEEIARLLGGATVTETTLASARELIASS